MNFNLCLLPPNNDDEQESVRNCETEEDRLVDLFEQLAVGHFLDFFISSLHIQILDLGASDQFLGVLTRASMPGTKD